MFTDVSEARVAVAERLRDTGVQPSREQIDRLAGYLHLLATWNRRMNLTSLEDQASAVDRLVVEPVVASQLLSADTTWLIDVGSGGGSPAIPLKIMRPDLSLAMIEVKAKKGVFLREVARHLSLDRVTVSSCRFEEELPKLRAPGRGAISVRAVRVEESELNLFAATVGPGGQLLWFLSAEQQLPPLPVGLSVAKDVLLVERLASRCVCLNVA